jgi:radical SAM superfamily enzyme YgiQ (UPF0313 family)
LALKILLIMPDAKIHRLSLGPLRMSFREAPLTLTVLASLVPPDLNIDVHLIDESVDRIPLNEKFDLVGISVITGTAIRAYEYADKFRRMGSMVVLGGVHVSLLPDEAALHADSVVTGFAETVWPELLRDFSRGEMRARYDGGSGSLNGLPQPARKLQKRLGYMNPDTVMATRGCKSKCDFCSVAAARQEFQMRPVGEVIDEIRSIKPRRFVFNDVSMLEDREYAMELFTSLAPLKKIWGGLCTSRIGQDDEMLDMMHESGCVFLLIGFESLANQALNAIHKGFNHPDEYQELMRKLHGKNIIVMGCFIFGFDHDTLDVFQSTVETVDELKIDIPRYAIYTPYPKTEAFSRMKAEGRLLHENWEHFDTQHVVFQPKNMSPLELDNGFRWAYRKTFSIGSILRRTAGSGRNFWITFLGNLAYRIYLRRLQNEVERVPDGMEVASCGYS